MSKMARGLGLSQSIMNFEKFVENFRPLYIFIWTFLGPHSWSKPFSTPWFIINLEKIMKNFRLFICYSAKDFFFFYEQFNFSVFFYSCGLLYHNPNLSSSLELQNWWRGYISASNSCWFWKICKKLETLRSAFIDFYWPLIHYLNCSSYLKG